MRKIIFMLIVFAALFTACREEGTREVGNDAREFGYQVTVHCKNGMILHGWAETKEDISGVKRELKAACSIYDK